MAAVSPKMCRDELIHLKSQKEHGHSSYAYSSSTEIEDDGDDVVFIQGGGTAPSCSQSLTPFAMIERSRYKIHNKT